ncbi:MAG: FmdB family transcriptional regulator [Verrucomicrobiales bacterium]|nr:FmdB family transcriptional regulator [Verrucomicrobiales bacterium]
MPTYDYKCQKCGHQFEVFQSMKDDRLTDCPLEECDGEVKRLLGTGAGIIFKGSGFYETDYRSDSYKKAASADKKSSESSSSEKSDKSSSKSKGKSESKSSSSSTTKSSS